MEIARDKLTLLLVTLSLGTLAFEYDVLSGVIGINFGWLTFDDVGSKKPYVIAAVVVGLLVFALVLHLRSASPIVKKAYQDGYIYGPHFIKMLEIEVEKVVGSGSHSAPFDSFHPGLRRRNVDCGRFTMQGGRLSKPVIVSIPQGVHLHSLVRGVFCAFRRNIFINVYMPAIFAIWAIGVLVI